MALGCLTMLGGPGGAGKSILMAALEVAVAAGLPFLGSEVSAGEVIHADFDTDLRLQYPWYGRAARGMGLGRAPLSRIRYARPADDQVMMTLERVQQLRDEASAGGAALVVLDAFTAAFSWIRGNAAEEVAQVMAALRSIAAAGPAVVVLDHVPKPNARDPEGRGLLGSTLKSAGARAVHLLSRVPPRDVAGLDILKLETHKNNLAPMADPVGVQRFWDDDTVRFALCDLPEGERHDSSASRARRAILEHLDAHPGEVVPRKDLLEAVVERANVSERTFKRAASEAGAAGEVAVIQLGGQGNPVAYKSLLPTPPEKLAPNDPSVLDGLPLGPGLGPKAGSGLKDEDRR